MHPETARGAAPAYFHTLPPKAHLPSGAQCATWVRAIPYKENKGVNRPFNRRTGQHIAGNFFNGDAPAANKWIAPRVNGAFTGTTGQILRWAACKWGIDQDIVFAQAAVESWWRQTTLGDWETSGCPPGHPPGTDGRPGLCPQSWGILQNRYPYETSSWPGIARSTAMNADLAYAIWRACFDGYETWLNTVPHGTRYRAGDAWGCVGRWFAGRWRTQPALQYIAFVRKYLREKIWLQPDFQQP
jgi:autotransporter family porin